tara:strand:+ start:5426 stop:5872 length:447 start_codon:yes stop_codon:yes gene_type:complete
MQIKISRGISLYITTDRMIGYAVSFFSINAAIYHAIFVEGGAGGFGRFIHWPTIFSVLAIGLSMTYMKKHALKDNELGKMLRRDMAYSGWIVFMLNAVLIGGGMYNEDSKELANMGPALIRLVLCVQYGYVYGIIFEAFFTRDVKNES